MLKVLKFGGSSLASAEQFQKVRDIIKSEPERRYVVASAPGKRFSDDIKVTDLLYQCFRLAGEKKSIDETFEQVADRYRGIISELGIDFSLEEEFHTIKTAIMNRVGSDYIASRGEYLNSMILANYLGYDFIDAETGIFFFEDGSFDAERTNAVLSKLLKDHEYAVIPGFYGSMPNGTIRTFSRGGSDITGSIVARAVGADIYENWTDVSGMLMADPRHVKNPKTIEFITYKELRELSYMGATVMHEDAIFPVRKANIPINIRNTNAPADKGTMIVPKLDASMPDTIVTGIAGKVGFSSIIIEKDMMNSELGFGRKVLGVLEKHKISFEHLPSGIDAISIIVNSAAIEGIEEEIQAEITKEVHPDILSIEHGLALIAVVGHGMVKSAGTAGRVFNAAARSQINIRMIDQGSGEMNIIFGVDEKDYVTALQAIYAEFAK